VSIDKAVSLINHSRPRILNYCIQPRSLLQSWQQLPLDENLSTNPKPGKSPSSCFVAFCLA
jgi:hypothetical protein